MSRINNSSHNDTQNSAHRQISEVTIAFQNLSYSVMVKNKEGLRQKRTILNNVSGICHPGQVTAILGASGAGKTSLLNILAKRISSNPDVDVQGNLTANKQPYDSNKFSQFAAYVMQNDVLFGTLSANEALTFVANLKYADPNEKQQRVLEVIRTLGLEKCQHTLIGNAFIKGISGGERKRVSIGIELMTDPYCILLDEPTSGLDSFTAFVLINLLKNLAVKKSRTVVFTIHQPSSDIFGLLDQILLLVSGQFIYQGPRMELVTYFNQIGYECPTNSNPLDFLMGIMHHTDFDHQQNLFNQYQNKWAALVDVEIQEIEETKIIKKEVQTSQFYQISEICRRGLINLKRDKMAVRGRLGMTIFMGLFQGGVYWTAAKGADTFQKMQSVTGVMFFLVMSSFMGAMNPVIVQFPAERDVFLREENSRLYSTGAYFFGKSSVEIPFLIIFPIIQSLISYWMIALNDSSAEIVITNFFICILLGLVGNSCGLMASAMFKDVRVAAAMVPLVIMPIVLFSGFYANQALFMDWIGWIQYISPMKYSFEALVTNQYSNIHLLGTSLEPDPVKWYSLTLGTWNCIGILIAMIFIFRFLALGFLYMLKSKQQ